MIMTVLYEHFKSNYKRFCISVYFEKKNAVIKFALNFSAVLFYIFQVLKQALGAATYTCS